MRGLSKFLLLTIAFAWTLDATAQDSLVVLNLQQCVDVAIKNNLTMKRSELAYQGNQVNLEQAKANRYPSLNFGASYGSNWGRSIDPTTNLFRTQQISTSGINGSAGVNLYTGGRIHNSVQQSKLDVSASQLDMEKARNDIALMVALAYLNVILNQELVENARVQVESSQAQLERTQRLVQIGSLPRTSELELVSQVASNEVTLINNQNALALAELDLKQSMLIPSNQQIEVIIPELELDSVPGISTTPEKIYQIALGTQPEIESADLKVKSAEYGIQVSNGAMQPTLSLRGNLFTNWSSAVKPFSIRDFDNPTIVETPIGYFYPADMPGSTQAVYSQVPSYPVIGETETGLFDQWSDNFSQSISLNLSIPVFNNFQTRSDIQRSKIQKQQAEITSIEQRNTLRQNIESAYNQALSTSNTYAASLRQVEALEETYRAVENQYNLGAANFTDYQVASNNLFRAKSDLVRAKYNFIFRMKVLDFYQGIPISLD